MVSELTPDLGWKSVADVLRDMMIEEVGDEDEDDDDDDVEKEKGKGKGKGKKEDS